MTKKISDEELAEIVLMLNNHQILKARNKLLSLEDVEEQTPEEKIKNKPL